MGEITHPELSGIDLEKSFITGVIYDDDSLTLEMDFNLGEDHPAYQASNAQKDGCFRAGFIRFAALDDLRLAKAHPKDGQDIDYSDIYEATLEANYVYIHSGWGEIELTAQSIQIALD